MQVPNSPHASVPASHTSDQLIREREAALLLTVTVKCLQAWRVSGKGPPFLKLGKGLRAAVRYRRADLMHYLSECVRTSTSEHSAGAGE